MKGTPKAGHGHIRSEEPFQPPALSAFTKDDEAGVGQVGGTKRLDQVVETFAVGQTSSRADEVLVRRDAERLAQRGDFGCVQPAMGSE